MSTADTPESKTSWFGRMPLWGRILLIGSVAVNLLILGSLIGMGFGGHHHGWRGEHRLLRHIPDDQREEVRQIFKKHRAEVRPLRKVIRENRRGVLEYLKQDEIDAGELESKLVALEGQQQEARVKLRAMVLELSAKLQPEDRARVMRRLLGDRRGRHRRRWRRNRE